MKEEILAESGDEKLLRRTRDDNESFCIIRDTNIGYSYRFLSDEQEAIEWIEQNC